MMCQRWWVVALSVTLISACCGVTTLALGRPLLSPAEVRPPYPHSELLDTSQGWRGRSWHVIRRYVIPAEAREVIDWYRNEGPGASARVSHSVTSRCSENVLFPPPLRLPVRLWTLTPVTAVRYCPIPAGVLVTTDTFYQWRMTGR